MHIQKVPKVRFFFLQKYKIIGTIAFFIIFSEIFCRQFRKVNDVKSRTIAFKKFLLKKKRDIRRDLKEKKNSRRKHEIKREKLCKGDRKIVKTVFLFVL